MHLFRLSKLACASRALRKAVLLKHAKAPAGLLSKVWGWAKKSPGQAAGTALTTGLTAMGTKAMAEQNFQGFRPEVHKAMMGQPPRPPG